MNRPILDRVPDSHRIILAAGVALLLGVTAALGGCSSAESRETGHAVLPMAPPGAEANYNFSQWLSGFRAEAIKQGISPNVFDRATKRVTFDQSVIDADQNQPEFAKPVWVYLKSSLSPKRVATGQALLAENAALLDRIEKAYGVDRNVVVAIWGLESNFGEHMGTQNVVRSLATLGFEGRRPEFGRTQLIAALRILQAGDIQPEEMTGSWAGAMGQTQFIPTTYLAHAMDFDGDGRRDIWHSTGDALASTAHYLQVSGWKTGANWGHEVSLPPGFDYRLADMSVTKPVSEWQALGVKRTEGTSFPAVEKDAVASIFLPAGYKGPAFLTLSNFKTILVYNASTSYAMAVNLLADSFRGGGTIRHAWPLDERPLSRSERMELQELLNAKGYVHGKADGIIGYETRKAIRQYQATQGVPPDGYATSSLLVLLRSK